MTKKGVCTYKKRVNTYVSTLKTMEITLLYSYQNIPEYKR